MPVSKYKDPYTIALAAILMLNALLKWRFFIGLSAADDFSYGVYAFTMFREPLPWDMNMDFRVLRQALLVPAAILFLIIPPTTTTAVLYPLAVSFGTVYLVYLIGKKLYGIHAGLFAAFVIATFPGDVVFGSMLLPDIVAPFYMSLAVFAFLKATDGKSSKTALWHLISGCSVFLAFITRENSYYFLLFYLPFAFNRERWKKGLYLVGVGFAAPVLVLYGFYFIKSGDFLFNLHLAQHYRNPLIESGYIPGNSGNWYNILRYMVPGIIYKMIGRTENISFISSMYGYTFYIGIPCLVYVSVKAFRKRNAALAVVPLWFFAGYLFLEFGTISFASYQMMKKLPRFLLTLTPAMALGFGVVLTDAAGLGSRKIQRLKKIKIRWVSASVALVVMVWLLYTSAGVTNNQKESRDSNLSVFRWGYHEVLKGRPHKPIYGTGGWWFNKLPFYLLPDTRYAHMPWNRSELLRDLMAVSDPEELSGAYVILDRRHFSGENDLRVTHSYDDAGTFILLPPSGWKLLGANYHVEIYEVPEGWKYTEPDSKTLVRGALLHAVEMDELMRFYYCLHPDFMRTLDRNSFYSFFNMLKNMSGEERQKFLDEKALYGEISGKLKINFKI
jgi:hypothetical protein